MAPDDIVKIDHIRKAREALKQLNKKSKQKNKDFIGIFFKVSKVQCKATGNDIARRLAKLKKLRGKK